jgi:hypothetical protein
MGLESKPTLLIILVVLNAALVALAYILSQGDIKITILWIAIFPGITAGISYCQDQEKTEDCT